MAAPIPEGFVSSQFLIGFGSITLFTAIFGLVIGFLRRKLPLTDFTLLVIASVGVGGVAAGYLYLSFLTPVYAVGGLVIVVVAVLAASLYTMAQLALSDV
ncbi:MAG: hypothetical protein ABEI86_01090 [Halobacteriaceae archaeon]